MGGLGSGRHYYCNAKATTEDYLTLDIRKWSRNKLFVPGNTFSCKWSRYGEQISSISVFVAMNKVTLSYRDRGCDGGWRDYNYCIKLDWSACSYGGKRPWFLCPMVGCSKRVAILYGGAIFACRNCYKLAYKSQSETAANRATRRADKIRDKLDWEPGILNGEGLKPKGMHWSTFERLFVQHEHFVRLSVMDFQRRFGQYGDMLDGLI